LEIEVMKRITQVLIFLFVVLSSVSADFAQRPSDQGPGLAVKGLKDEVTVRRDGRSIPYIEAKNDADLYFAQGYETARDRLWQMDLLRRAARGRLAELFGNAVVNEDIRWRRFGFAAIAEESLKVMDPDLKKALEDYARGVNAYIASLDAKLLPTEFQILKYEPEPWQPTDTIMIGKILADALSTTWPNDLNRFALGALPKEKQEELLGVTDPLDVVLFGKDTSAELRIENGKSLDQVNRAAVVSVDDLSRLSALASREEAIRKGSLERIGFYSPELAASNNWVISGKKTLDGKALLANDPHLRPAAPGIWYLTQLSAPGVRVSGVTFPGVPGVVLGHNENFAWGATNVGPDVQDVYFEEFNDKGEYKTPSGWKKAVVRTEIINVRKGLGPETEAREIEVVETRNGPVIGEAGGRNYALKWTAFEPGSQEFEAFFRLNRAKGWDGFKSALKTYGGAMQNFVYADTEGNIGWYAAGKIPIRKKGEGELPYDGATDDGDWTGYIPFDELPHLYNPPSGFIVTANQRIIGTDYKYQQLTRQFAPPWRARRIYDLISANSKITMNDISDIQHDVFNIPVSWLAREVVKRGAASKESLDLLIGWDGKMTADSRAAVVANDIRNCLGSKIAEANKPVNSWDIRERFLNRFVAENDLKWLPEGVASYDELMKSCDPLAGGSTGSDGNLKVWGEERVADFNHPLSAAPFIGGRFKLTFTNVDGSGQTPNVGSGVSMRHIAKPSNWDETRHVIPLGESGDPSSPYWKDQFESWRTGKPAIFPFSPDAVMKAAEITLKLIPAN
jgi:penicillin amidase